MTATAQGEMMRLLSLAMALPLASSDIPSHRIRHLPGLEDQSLLTPQYSGYNVYASVPNCHDH